MSGIVQPSTALRRVAALLLCAGIGAAWASPGQAATLVLAVARSALSLPVHVADEQGFFAAEGVDVRTVDCEGGQRCLKQVFDGAAQLATASELPVVFNSFERKDYAIVATFVTSTRNIRLVARRSAGVKSAQDLIGKRIGVVAGTSSHYFLDAFLLFHGVDPKQLKISPLLPDQLIGSIERREVDAMVGYSQHTWPALKMLAADGLTLDAPRLYTETFNLIVDRRSLVERANDIVKLLRALERAERFIAAQPQRAKDIMRKRVNLSAEFADAVLPDFNYRLSLEQSLVSTMEGQARWALREAHVPPDRKIPNYLDYVDAAALRVAVPAAFPR